MIIKNASSAQKNKFRICDHNPCVAFIEITQNQEVMVDHRSIQWLRSYRWHAKKNRSRGFYAMTCMSGHKPRHVSMHRLIMGNSHLIVDHINGNTLDNRSENLRFVTASENCRNRRPYSKTSSSYLGVSYLNNGMWRARFSDAAGNRVLVGDYKEESTAGIMRARAFVDCWGENCNTGQTSLSRREVVCSVDQI